MVGENLSPKKRQFAELWVLYLDKTRAAREAGYSAKTANRKGYELYNEPEVQEYIEHLQAEMRERHRQMETRILEELASLSISNMQDYVEVQEDGTACVDLSSLTREQAAAIQEITVDQYVETIQTADGEKYRPVKKVKVKLIDKTKNIELFGKHLGTFKGGGETPDVHVTVNVDTDSAREKVLGRINQFASRRGSLADSGRNIGDG